MTDTPASPTASGDLAAPEGRLRELPDWLYLLREFETLYRMGSAGGSAAIRAHRRKVRDALSGLISSNAAIALPEPQAKPVTAHLGRALDLGERGAMQGMARALRELRGSLSWVHGYERLPKALAQKYAFCDIASPHGPIRSDELTLGFVLFAPGTTYPQHSHPEIEESYISIAGAWSENDTAVYAPGSLVLNTAGHEHRITTGDLDPCLLAYAWVGPTERLAAPGMKLTARRRTRPASG